MRITHMYAAIQNPCYHTAIKGLQLSRQLLSVFEVFAFNRYNFRF